jgi:ornithine decarboxylase
MIEAKFLLSKKKVLEQYEKLKELGIKISYSLKTNHEVAEVLQEITNDCEFSIHAKEEIEGIENKTKIWFFLQAESEEELGELLARRIKKFVVDNETDFRKLLKVVSEKKVQIDVGIRMKCQEHRIGSGRYFVYGMSSKKVNELVLEVQENEFVKKVGVHIHRKSQNTSEWNLKEELKDSLSESVLEVIEFVNLGGGLPIQYRSHSINVEKYIFSKILETKDWLKEFEIETYIEPGRFIAGPAVKLQTEIVQIYDSIIVLNTTLYNCALDTLIGQNKMFVEGELEHEGDSFLIKGNSPTRDDIFRYKVKLKNPRVGDTITFLNAGAYNYTTDFFGYKKLKTVITGN